MAMSEHKSFNEFLKRDQITGKAYLNIMNVCKQGKSLSDVKKTICTEYTQSMKRLQVTNVTAQQQGNVKMLKILNKKILEYCGSIFAENQDSYKHHNLYHTIQTVACEPTLNSMTSPQGKPDTTIGLLQNHQFNTISGNNLH